MRLRKKVILLASGLITEGRIVLPLPASEGIDVTRDDMGKYPSLNPAYAGAKLS